MRPTTSLAGNGAVGRHPGHGAVVVGSVHPNGVVVGPDYRNSSNGVNNGNRSFGRLVVVDAVAFLVGYR